MRWNKLALIPAACAALALGACAEDLQEEVAEGELPRTPAEVPARDPGVDATANPFVDPALDANGNGVLDPDEGLSDTDGDGVLDRDEPYEG